MPETSGSPDSRFVKILKAIGERLDVHFRGLSSQITHAGAKGTARERALIHELLRQHLPNRFGLTRGEIIASNEEVSSECDVIIYDGLECPALYTEEHYQIVPIEAVYGVIEVKSYLDSEELEKTLRNFQKIKRFPKTAFLPVDPDRKRHFHCFGEVLNYFPVFGFLFAYRSSVALDTLAAHLQELQKDTSPEHRMELICVLKSGCLLNSDPTLTRYTAGPNTSVVVFEGDHPVLFFMGLLQNLLSTARTDPIAINTYLGTGSMGKLRRPIRE